MNTLPRTVQRFVFDLIVKNRPLAYLKTNRNGMLLDSGGQLQAFEIGKLDPRIPVDQQIFYLTGLLPVGENQISYSCLEVNETTLMEIHLFGEEEYDWIILLAASEETHLRRQLLRALKSLAT